MRNPCYETYTTVEELISWHLECLDYFRESVKAGKYKGEDFLRILQQSWKALDTARGWSPEVREYLEIHEGMQSRQGKPDYMIWANSLSRQELELRRMLAA